MTSVLRSYVILWWKRNPKLVQKIHDFLVIPESERVRGAVDIFGYVTLQENGVEKGSFRAESSADISENADDVNGAIAGNGLVGNFVFRAESGRAFRYKVSKITSSSARIEEGSFTALSEHRFAVSTQVVKTAISGVRDGVGSIVYTDTSGSGFRRIFRGWELSVGGVLIVFSCAGFFRFLSGGERIVLSSGFARGIGRSIGRSIGWRLSWFLGRGNGSFRFLGGDWRGKSGCGCTSWWPSTFNAFRYISGEITKSSGCILRIEVSSLRTVVHFEHKVITDEEFRAFRMWIMRSIDYTIVIGIQFLWHNAECAARSQNGQKYENSSLHFDVFCCSRFF